MFTTFYKDKRVMVTGDTGFKGSWLCLWLYSLGAKISGLGLKPESDRDNFYQFHLENKVTHCDLDIRDANTLSNFVQKEKPEIIFHLAAQSLVQRSYEEAKTTFDTNIGGTVNVIEAAMQALSVKALLCITSDKCYKNNEWVWGYRENDPLGGEDPYSASKAAAEMVIYSYQRSFLDSDRCKIGLASARAGNVIGGGDWAKDRLVPDCIQSLEKNQSIGIRNPKSTRPWQHVLEPLSGYLLLGQRLYEDPKKFSSAWNFGPENDSVLNVEGMVQEVTQIWGSPKYSVQKSDSAHSEHNFLQVNLDKTKMQLGWKPTWDLKKAIHETVTWYRQVFHKKIDPAELAFLQIRAYQNEMKLSLK